MKLLFFTSLICSSYGFGSRRRRQNDLPYCIGGQTSGCQICDGTPFQYIHNRVMVGCCEKGVFFQGRCVKDAVLDRNGELCKFPMGLDQNGDCFPQYPGLIMIEILFFGFLMLAGILFGVSLAQCCLIRMFYN